MTLRIPKYSILPMKGLAEREYAREYPQNIHWKQTLAQVSELCGKLAEIVNTYTPMTAKDWNSSERADLRRARPE
jgi:hypothetical protein